MKSYEFRLIFKPNTFLVGLTYFPAEDDYAELNVYMLFMVFHFKVFV